MKKGLFSDREELTKNKIFNTIPILNNQPKEREAEPLNLKQNQNTVVEEKKKEATPAPIDDNDDDWGAVPAFLRRSKIK
jgi:hypothetical protein